MDLEAEGIEDLTGRVVAVHRVGKSHQDEVGVHHQPGRIPASEDPPLQRVLDPRKAGIRPSGLYQVPTSMSET